MAGPIRCTSCQHTDFFVVSTGVNYRNGTLMEVYRWPGDAIASFEAALDSSSVHDAGYQVDQQVLEEPQLESIDGPVRALCAACLKDLTDQYLQIGRESTLPV
jgi:hypothetical protein